MDIKKYSIVYLLIGVAGGLFAISLLIPNLKLGNFPQVQPTVSTEISGSTVKVDFGNKQKTYSGIQAPNAYLALVEAVKQDGLEVETKSFDFGLMIEKVGEAANNQEYFWSYRVNNLMGDVSADNKLLVAGDTVEWKYEKIKN